MNVTYKKIFIFQNLNEAIAKLNLSSDDYAILGKLSKTVKKLAPKIEEFQEMVEDLRLDHCMKDGLKIVREEGQLQWTVEGEKAFRKAYKNLLEKEVELDGVSPLSYGELVKVLPAKSLGEWEDVKDTFSPFFENYA